MNQGPIIKIKGSNKIFEDIRHDRLQDLTQYITDLDNLDLLLSNEVELGPFDNSYELNPLEAAVVYGHVNAVKTLAEKIKPDLNFSFSLTLAAGFGHLDIFNFLLAQKNIDPTNAGYQGGTNEALCWAIANKYEKPHCQAIAVKLLSNPLINPEAVYARAFKVAKEHKKTFFMELLQALRTTESFIARGICLEFALMQEPDITVFALYIKYLRDGKDPFKGLNHKQTKALEALVSGDTDSSKRYNLFGSLDEYYEHKNQPNDPKPIVHAYKQTVEEEHWPDASSSYDEKMERMQLYRQII